MTDGPADTAERNSPDDEEITALVDGAMQAHLAGGEERLAQYCAALVRHREIVMQRLSALRRVGLLGEPAPAAAAVPERLGDFELLEPLGRGGMGVVYRARQITLDREVAVKLIRPEQLHFPGTRERFQREIEIVARLQNEGVVRLYSFGEDRGIPWFAMELVRGISLAQLIEAMAKKAPAAPTSADLLACLPGAAADGPGAQLFAGEWTDIVLRLVERVALALDEAHRQGVLHRDIKPSNIMLTASGRVVLLDFGLAWSPHADRLTRSGSELGTVHYMAPEQFAGDSARVDERTDVYALGVVLRELVTLRSVFTGTTIDEVARQVREGVQAPFRGSRSSAVRDIETICLVAMDRDPQRRYASARLFARDLRCVLERRPIEAVRPALALRLRRFAQRNRALATAIVVVLVALLAAPLWVAWREHGIRVQLQQANRELQEQIARADGNLRLASEAIDDTLCAVEDEEVSAIPDLAPFVERMLARSATFLESLARSNPADPAARLWLARTLARAANVQWSFFDLPRTEPLFQRALELVQTSGGDVDHRDELELEVRLSLVWVRRLRGDEAVDAYEAALARVAAGGAFEARPLSLRRLIARCMERCGNMLYRGGRPRGRELLDQAARLREQIAVEAPSVLSWVEVAASARELAGECDQRRDKEGAVRQRQRFDAALDAAETCPVAMAIEDRNRLVSVLLQRSFELGVEPRAIQCLQRAERHCRTMVELRPSRLTWLERWCDVSGRYAGLLQRVGRVDEALRVTQAQIEHLRGALATWSFEPNLIRTFLQNVRFVVQQSGDPAAATIDLPALLEEAAIVARRAVDAPRRRAATLDQGHRLFVDTARLRLRTGNLEAALSEAREAQRLLASAIEQAAADRIQVTDEPSARLLEVEALLRLGRVDEAAVAAGNLTTWPANGFDLAPSLRALESDARFAPLRERLRRTR